nr:unnamed protein product [Callosobruchus chinensis]
MRPSRRAIWISLLGFEKTHSFPKYVEICSKHFMKAMYLGDGNSASKSECCSDSCSYCL